MHNVGGPIGANGSGDGDDPRAALFHNAFQWRNLYHHRYGVSTYAPPLPRNPSTTTMEHPNIHAYHALREQQQENDGNARKSIASTIAEASGVFSSRSASLAKSFERSDSIVSADYPSPTAAASGGPQQRNMLFSRSSFLMQRKAQLLLKKKHEMEALRKQNPYGLESCILSIHQAAWTLIMDDKVMLGSAMEARDFGESAREMKERLADQLRHTLMAIDSPFALDDPSGTQGDPSMAIGPRAGDHAFPSGSTHPLHATINDAHERRVHLLAEFSPFFAAVSPPNVVSHLHGIASAKAGLYVAPRPGGAGDGVGLPIFSQYATWEEACTQRGAWARAPFHFFLTRDGSFHQSHVIAVVLMLETIGRYMHRHTLGEGRGPTPRAVADGGRNDARKLSNNNLSHTMRVPLPPSVQARGDAVGGRSGSRSNTLLPGVSQFSQLLGATQTPLEAQPTRRSSTTPELWNGKQRYDGGKQCSTANNPNPCPTLALEQVLEDALIVFEHAGARNALPMITTTMQLFLDKSMKPGLSQQLFGKAALLDVYVTEESEEDVENAPPPTFFGSGGASRNQQFAGVVPQLLHALDDLASPSAQRTDMDDDTDDDEGQQDDDASTTVFSEREFHALFSLSQWFLDAPLAIGSGAIPVGGGGGAAALIGGRQRRKRSPSATSSTAQGYTRIQLAARAPTLSLAEAVVRYEEARRARKQLAILEWERDSDAAESGLDVDKRQEEEELREQQPQLLTVDKSTRSREPSTNSLSDDRSYYRRSSVAHTQAFLHGLPSSNGSATSTPRPSTLDVPLPSTHPRASNASFIASIDTADRQGTPEPARQEASRAPSKERLRPKDVVERELPSCTTKMATPLIILSSYMKLHGVTWCSGICRGLFDFLSHPDIVLYVTDDQLPPLPAEAASGSGSTVRGASVFSAGDSKSAKSAGGTVPVASPRTSLSTTLSEGLRSRVPSLWGTVGADGEQSIARVSPTTMPQQPLAWKFPVDEESSAFSASEQASPTGSSAASTQFFSTAGVDPVIVDFLSAMMQRENDIAQHIIKAMDIWFRALERSHSSQKLPSGIGYLVTTLCTMVHSHLLSGVVMTSALNADGIEPDSLEFVDHLVDALIGGEKKQQPSQQPPADSVVGGAATIESMDGVAAPKQPTPPTATAPAPRRRATVILDPSHEDLQNSTRAPQASPVPPRPTRSGSIGGADASDKRGAPSTADADDGTGNASSTSNSLVNDIRSFRLAKFVLFDMWLLPLLNNAQRFGLLPPSSSQHLLNNVNAFARYAKILVNAMYVQRDEERKKQTTTDSGGAATARDAANNRSGAGADASIRATLTHTTIPPFISGIYNASNGCLMQLFRHPEKFMGDNASSGGATKKSTATLGGSDRRRSSGGRRRSGGGGSSRRSSTVVTSPPSVDDARRGTRVGPRRGSVRPSSSASPNGDAYYVLQEHSWPELVHISAPLQMLNNVLGITTASAALGESRRASYSSDGKKPPQMGTWGGMGGSVVASGEAGPLGTKGKTAAQLLQTFCWHASTDDDRHRVVPEFQVPSHVAAACCDNLFRVIAGQHPATSVLARAAGPFSGGSNKGTPSVTDLGDANSTQQHRQSIVSATSDPTSAPLPGDGPPSATAVGKGDGISKDATDMYLRCLHSVLLHPTIAGMALDCISVNHRKLFQQLIRLHKPVEGARDATSMACSLYPYLIVGVKDQPLIDVNAIAVLTTSMSSKEVPLPSAFIHARRRLLARQLYLATSANIDVNALAQSERATGSPRRRRSSHSVELPSEQPNRSADSGDAPPAPQPLFAPWWCYMAAALCAKAECVLEECCGTTALRWDKRCRQTMRRYSHRDSVTDVRPRAGNDAATAGHRKGGHKPLTVTIEGPGGAPKVPAKVQKNKSGSSPTRSAAASSKLRAVPSSQDGPARTPRSVNLTMPLGSEAPLGQRRVSIGSTANSKRCGNALMQRWREAVTDMVRREDDTEVSSTYTT